MISDPLDAFRRAAAALLARMERSFVERALALPGIVVDQAARAARGAVASEAQQMQAAPAIPLSSDVTYRVRISGAGFSAVRDFRLTPRGVTVQN